MSAINASASERSVIKAVSQWLRDGRDNPHANEVPIARRWQTKAANRRFHKLLNQRRALRKAENAEPPQSETE